jgi:enamine deaminase RidA (YjgF/YER057c/UK114 family)
VTSTRRRGRTARVLSDIRPASTMLLVSALADPRWHVEMEAQALLD